MTTIVAILLMCVGFAIAIFIGWIISIPLSYAFWKLFDKGAASQKRYMDYLLGKSSKCR